MHRFKIEDLQKTFKNTFNKPNHKYPTKFSFCIFNLKKHFLNCSRFAISCRGPKVWNEILSIKEKTKKQKKIESQVLFQKRIKQNC